IRDDLLGRLGPEPSPDRLLRPDGIVRAPRGTDIKSADPAFLAARGLLEEAKYDEARLAFSRLAERVQSRGAANRPRDICRNYEAYAWARAGELTFARNCLKELIASEFPLPSAYWNYACCLPAEERATRLAVLVQGLERAPHMLALHGAVR